MDDEGYVDIVVRIEDMIIRGGENVYPQEIEEFLYSHPAVSDARVIGVPDPKYGEEIMASLRLRSGATVTAEELREFCMGQIARHKGSRYFKFVSEFPMTVIGKIQKFLMRVQSIKEFALEVVAKIKTA